MLAPGNLALLFGAACAWSSFATGLTELAILRQAMIGLPEILVGLFAGAGGTTRLVRKLGLQGAAPYLLEGKLLGPHQAAEAGLVDEVVAPSHRLLSRVIERGVRGIATSLNFLLFNIIPTIVEILFVSVILWWMFALFQTRLRS